MEINIIIRKVIKNISLNMQHGVKLDFISYISHNYLFFCLCKNVEITIKELKTRYLIFIVKQKDYNLILDLLFLNLIKFSQKYKSNNIFSIITHFYIQ